MKNEKYDYLVVGCGLYGAVFARKMTDAGKRVLIIERRCHLGGNCYTKDTNGVHVHFYGPHIFHTSSPQAWEFVNRFAKFNNFVNRPKVIYKDKIYAFPLNLMTLNQLWGVKTPQEAKEKLRYVAEPISNPENLEQWVLSQVGRDIYEIFIEGYTTKQWKTSPDQLPADIVRRIPIRLTYDDNYYEDEFQGIPIGGYTAMFEKMLEDIEVRLNQNYLEDSEYWDEIADKVLYTGRIDELFGSVKGRLGFRSLKFDHKHYNGDYQGNAVINYTEQRIPYTRVIEHKHFENPGHPFSVVTWEYPADEEPESVVAYPIPTEKNLALYQRYAGMARENERLIIGGRLGTYQYLDMDDTIIEALNLADKELLHV